LLLFFLILPLWLGLTPHNIWACSNIILSSLLCAQWRYHYHQTLSEPHICFAKEQHKHLSRYYYTILLYILPIIP
jgi:hypothetical protein